jgi:hypothetical protein
VATLGGGLTLWRVFLLLGDLGIAALLIMALRSRSLDPRLSVLYLWHPLVVVETMWSAHAETLPVLLFLGAAVLVARGKRIGAGIAIGLGGAAKLLPFGFLPFLLRRTGGFPLLVAILVASSTLIPFLSVDLDGALDGLNTYAESWYFNDALFRPLGFVLGIDAEDRTLVSTQRLRQAMGGIWILVCLGVAWRFRDPFRAGLWIAGGFVLLTPTLHPWYLLWVLPFAIVRENRPWLLLSVLVLLVYTVKYVERELGVWREIWPTRVMEFLPPLLLFLWGLRRRRPPSLAGPVGQPESPGG